MLYTYMLLPWCQNILLTMHFINFKDDFFLFLVLQLGENLVGTISNMMDADTSLLQEAQRRSKSCSRFVFLNSFKPFR